MAETLVLDNEILKALIALIFTGIIGGMIKVYYDYKVQLMGSVWEKRLIAYMSFVKLTSLFPKYPRKKVQLNEVYTLSEKFRDWYFEGNGLLLSNKIRSDYFSLQEYILIETKGKENSIQELSDSQYDNFKKKCSNIRALMAKELESRESPIWHRFSKKQTV